MQKVLIVIGDGGILTRQAMEIAAMLDYTDVQCHESLDADSEHVFIASDDVQVRAELMARVDAKRLVNLIHPTASVSTTAKLMKNIIVGAQAVIGSNAQVALGVVQNALSSIEHDNQIGAYTFLGTGAILCGNVSTGEFVFVGGGVTILPGLTIGAHTTVGGGAVLVKDAMDNATYIGNPARKIDS